MVNLVARFLSKGGSMFTAQKPEVLVSVLILVMLFALIWGKRLPTVQGSIDLVNVLNTKGGNILVLSVFCWYFFVVGIRFLYHSFDLVAEGKFDPAQALFGQGFQWISGMAFGSAIGALLKTMSPQDMTTATPKPTDPQTAVKTITTTTVEEKKTDVSPTTPAPTPTTEG